MNGQAYSDWDEFDPADYGWRRYGKVTDIDRDLIMGALKKLESMGLQPESLQRVAEVGAGPNLYPSLLLAPFIAPRAQGGRLELIEYSQSNLDYLRTLFAGRPASPPFYIWEQFESLMASHSPLWRHALPRVRDVAVVQSGDIYTLPAAAYDAITAFFVPDSITDSLAVCKHAVAKLVVAVKPGGLVMFGHILRSEGYPAGAGTRFPGVSITVEDLHRMYDGELDDLTIIEPPHKPQVQDDYHDAAIVLGRRRAPGGPMMSAKVQELFTMYGTQTCLYDKARTLDLQQAIWQTVRPGDVVVDAGSGSGVLGMMAVQAGAAKVYCVELNEAYVAIARENTRANGMEDKMVVLQGDAATICLPEPVDVIISEVISGGFFYEPQLQIMQHMRQFLKPGGRTVPAAIDTFVELIDAQDELYGLTFRDARYHALDDVSLTTRAKYVSVDFLHDTPLSIVTSNTVRCTTPGRANAVRITYIIWYSEGVLGTEPTEVLLNPQIIFLPEFRQLQMGAYYKVSLRYEAGGSPLACQIGVEPVDSPEST